MLAAAAATLALMGAGDPGYDFARSLALDGPRPAAGAAERRAHRRVAEAFSAAGLTVVRDPFPVPGHESRSRNVIGALARPGDCLWLLMAHGDTVPPSPGAEDNASGVGTLVALAPRVAALEPACDVWLVATGAEERIYTGRADHLGASALVQRVRARGRAADLRWALSLDEVGRGREMWLRSPARRGLERRVEAAPTGRVSECAGSRTAAPATRTIASSGWRDWRRASWACRTIQRGTPPPTSPHGCGQGPSCGCGSCSRRC
jgi:hypothetical protein